MQGSTNFIQSQNHILDRKFDLAEKNLLFCNTKAPKQVLHLFLSLFFILPIGFKISKKSTLNTLLFAPVVLTRKNLAKRKGFQSETLKTQEFFQVFRANK
jgi:hypothetical protein